MVMDLRPSYIFQFFQRGDRPYTSESDVCRRPILTYKDDPRAKRAAEFIIADSYKLLCEANRAINGGNM